VVSPKTVGDVRGASRGRRARKRLNQRQLVFFKVWTNWRFQSSPTHVADIAGRAAGKSRGSQACGLPPRINLSVDESREFGRLVPCSGSSHACQGVVSHKVTGNSGPVDRWRWLCCSAPAGDVRLPAPAVSSRIVSSHGGGDPKTRFRAVHVSERAKLCRHGMCGAGSAQEKAQFIPPGI
jgi:hypothetical protein